MTPGTSRRPGRPGWPFHLLADRRHDAADLALAVVLTALGVATVLTHPRAPTGATGLVALVASVLLTAPLAWRRRAPAVVLGCVAVATAVIWVLGPTDMMTGVAGAISLYGLGRYTARPSSVRVFAVTALGLGALAAWLATGWATGLIAGDAVQADAHGWASFFARCGVVVASFWFGDSLRSRAALLAALQERARRVEADRAEAERRAVAEERARISREVHDVVAHSLSVMVVQATAASRLLDRDPAAAGTAIGHVVDVGRAALTDMRHVLGRLDERDDPGAPGAAGALGGRRAPLPTLADLGPLLDRCRAAGLTVTLHREGTQAALPAGVDLAAVRVVQEALTNVLKHAPGADVVVRLRSSAAEVVIDVEDDGAPGGEGRQRAPGTGDGQGRGLAGLRERVEALGGTFRAGPASPGGFAVRAVVPLGAVPLEAVPQGPRS